jgi:hypothetical protein
MSQVTTVRAVPALTDALTSPELATSVEVAPKIVDKKPDWERRAWLYHGKQKIESMSMRQLRGAVRGVARSRAKELPRERDEKVKVNKAALIDVALATILEVILDSHDRGVSLYPR